MTTRLSRAGIRWDRLVLAAAIGLLVNRLAVIALSDLSGIAWAQDFLMYREAAQRWLDGGEFYLSWQVSGPYEIGNKAVLYPPPILILLVPFTVLPMALWWVLPLAAVAWAIWRLRPSALGWAGMIAALAAPNSLAAIANGNPLLWSLAALALGTIHAWPAAFAALKVSVAPVALFGSWHRSWWLAAAAALAISAVFLPMWPDYIQVLLNSRNPKGALYSIGDIWLLAVPLAAWAWRTRDGIPGPGFVRAATTARPWRPSTS
jgi:hypothetical protein